MFLGNQIIGKLRDLNAIDLPPFSVPMDKLVFSKHFNHKIA
ncbi:hypothetical protein LEP1GSC202_2836 [Leptospira yanagawae serovar Saopaulo str. Sao Paulo = ATCC 700523]|uniref:Uncharacterized protein n=1 Tax=Leptospira yanagawae serovar Saopaulo str. Sao Paulo = ATCC 700523 TaxID=1249483 RepID=A0A5E8HD94_9LEPT|nr:hypothetical protein LEP1GSC202_2836 [Leptospira yanagawae serovar Saopaulo str. Sao Paulo = ATCC 700523]